MDNANELQKLVSKRTGLKGDELVCPREKSSFTPCVARDGVLACSDMNECVGCCESVEALLENELTFHPSLNTDKQ